MWFITIISLFHVVHSHAKQFNIGCNRHTSGIAGEEEPISIHITNQQIQTVLIADFNDTFVSVLSLKNHNGGSIDRTDAIEVSVHDFGGNAVSTFAINGLLPGNYTVELIANEYGGGFNVGMLCSAEPFVKGTFVYAIRRGEFVIILFRQ